MPGSFRRLSRRLRTFGRLSGRERRLALEALAALALARLLLVSLPFRWTVPRLGRRRAGDVDTTEERPDSARGVGLAIRRVSRVTPWRSKCLEQAVAGQVLLRLRRLPGTLYLGLAKDGESLVAHAWLKCGELTVTGGDDVRRYRVVARFGQ